MNRADRLYALMQRLKDGRLHTAEAMAQDLGVSVRTIYRDMEVLAASGVPVEGARGAGYTARAAVTLPPLNLTPTEFEALHMALAVLGQAALDEVSEAARTLSAKIEAVLPEDSATAPNRFGFATRHLGEAAQGFRHVPVVRAAIRSHQKLRLRMVGGTATVLRPLSLDYWGRVWTCIAWDEGTEDFGSFRIDRVADLTVLPGLFVNEPGKTLADYQARQTAARPA